MIRKILIEDEWQEAIKADRDKWSAKGLETGGWLFGKMYPNGLAVISSVLDGGPAARRTPFSFTGDNEYATRTKSEIQDKDPDTLLLGEYHVHPWSGSPGLSGGDLTQLMEVKKQRPWFTVLLCTKESQAFFDLEAETPKEANDKDVEIGKRADQDSPAFKNNAKSVPYRVLKNGAANREKILDRILKVTKNDILMGKTVLIVGLGSGGATVAKYLGNTGIGRFILVDKEPLEVTNIIRHEGGIEDIGKPKVEICKHVIESHNPFTIVDVCELDAIEDTGKLEELISGVDLIIGSSGSPKVNHLLNKFSVEKGIPAVYGGVFEKASGGYVLAVKPHETACFNCLFKVTSESYSVDNEAAQRYGLDEDELHQQQGLWIDISFPSLILSKMALAILEGRELDCSLAVYDSKMEIKKMPAAIREDCAVCSEEGWVKRQELPSKKSAYASIWKKLRSLIRYA